MTDQAETVLMRLMRGTGLAGLAGIAPVVAGAPCPVVRPLLAIAGPDLRAWLEAEGIPFREDASNRDLRFLRNRIRAELLPELARHYEPQIVAHLARLAGIVREDDELLHGFVRELADEFILRQGRDVALDLKTLPLAPAGPGPARRPGIPPRDRRQPQGHLLRRRGIAPRARRRQGADAPQRARPAARRGPGRPQEEDRARRDPTRSSWDGRGELVLAAAGLTLKGARRKADASRRSFKNDDRAGADLDAAKLVFPLTVRNRKPGDLYRPLGAPGRKKLKEILRAKGVPAAGRDRLPVVLSRGEIVWVPGLPVGEKYKITAATTSVFSIRLVKGPRALGRDGPQA